MNMNKSNFNFVTVLSYLLIAISAFSLIWSLIYPFIVELSFNFAVDGAQKNNIFEMMPPMTSFMFSNIGIVAAAQAVLSIIALIGSIQMLRRKMWGLIIVSIVAVILSMLGFIYSYYLNRDYHRN